jgi:ABC-type sugar transport system ATPase subunit
MSMGTDIIILDRGTVQQQGPPRVIYEEPANVFVAGFTGSPPANLLQAGAYTFAVRPEHIAMDAPEGARLSLPGEIISSEHLGNQTIYSLTTRLGKVSVCGENLWDNGRRRVTLRIPPDKTGVFDQRDRRVTDPAALETAFAIFEEGRVR